MANSKPLTSEERLGIVEALRRGNRSHREIAKQFTRSQSTISAIAKGAGIAPTHRRRRTAAAKDVEGTYSREERVAIADTALSVLSDLLSSGGLSPRELREVTASLKQTLDARRAEDFPEVEGGARQQNVDAATYEPVSEQGVPKNLQLVFAVLDAEQARLDKHPEKLEEAEDRIKDACQMEGISYNQLDRGKILEEPPPYERYNVDGLA